MTNLNLQQAPANLEVAAQFSLTRSLLPKTVMKSLTKCVSAVEFLTARVRSQARNVNNQRFIAKGAHGTVVVFELSETSRLLGSYNLITKCVDARNLKILSSIEDE